MRTNNSGLVYVFTGNGKGKTSAALGMVVRSLGHNQKVAWVSWYKTRQWPIGEVRLPEMLSAMFRKRIKMYWVGKGFYLLDSKKKKVGRTGTVYDFDTPEGHKFAAESGLKLAKDLLTAEIPTGGTKIDLLVLDEVLVAVEDRLLSKKDIIGLIKLRGKTNIVLTGRGKVGWLTEKVDLVSEIQKVKHPYDKGLLAVPGMDF